MKNKYSRRIFKDHRKRCKHIGIGLICTPGSNLIRCQIRIDRHRGEWIYSNTLRDVCLALRSIGKGPEWPGCEVGRKPRTSPLQRTFMRKRAIWPDDNLRSRPCSEPLVRVGKRGEGKFRKASWDEALDHRG